MGMMETTIMGYIGHMWGFYNDIESFQFKAMLVLSPI